MTYRILEQETILASSGSGNTRHAWAESVYSPHATREEAEAKALYLTKTYGYICLIVKDHAKTAKPEPVLVT